MSQNSRQLQAQETKEKILSIANELIFEKEYDDITISEIAQKAGLSVGAIYHHFNSKEELFFSGYDDFDRRLEAYVNQQDYPCYLDAIRDLIRYQASGANKAGPVFRAKEIRVQLSTHSRYVLSSDRFLHQYLKSLVTGAVRAGEMKADCDAEEVASVIFRMVRGDLFDWALRQSKDKAEKNPLHDLEIILAYYRAE